MTQRYLIALGSNVWHHRHGPPAKVVRAALQEIASRDIAVERASTVYRTAPLGHSRRRFANAAAVVRCADEPDNLLKVLQDIEKDFGRRAGGRRWGARVLDLDIVLWSGGAFASETLIVPHPAFRERSFVLRPATDVAPAWRDPLTARTVRQLTARLTRPRPAPR